MRPWSKLAVLIAVPLAFAAGILASDPVRAIGRMFVDESHPRRLDGKVCIGSPAPEVFSQIDGDRHGITGMFCDKEPDLNRQFLRMDDVIAVTLCRQASYIVEL